MLLILNFLLHLTFIPHKKIKNNCLQVKEHGSYCIDIDYTKSGYGNSQLVEYIIKPHI